MKSVLQKFHVTSRTRILHDAMKIMNGGCQLKYHKSVRIEFPISSYLDSAKQKIIRARNEAVEFPSQHGASKKQTVTEF